MSGTFDAIVVGGGVMGTAAAHELAARGRNTLLLERFTFGHSRGSSGGPTRIFRFTYEHPDYVRMAGPALEAWRELEDISGERLLHTTGGIDIGEGSRRSAEALEAAGSPFAWLTPAETMERWPGLVIAPGTPVFVQELGGVCMAERTVRAQARAAAEAGATVIEERVVESIMPADRGDVEVKTTGGDVFRAPVAVVTAGPWAAPLLRTAGIELPLVPSFEQVTYCRLAGQLHPFPTITDWTGVSTLKLESDGDGSSNLPYALPNPEEPGSIKMALDRSGPDVDPDARSFEPDLERLERLAGWASKRFLPLEEARPPETCLYTNTPDGEFVLDRLGPIVVGSPCSGHGFKFGPLIGKILADMATGRPIGLRLYAFRAGREWTRRHLMDRAFDV
ncbi:MAG: FAD-dependent oxidoreductase [Actinomycetota bacterium]